MTIAEKAAIAWVNHMFQVLVIEKGNAGLNFNPETYKIELVVDVNLFASYRKGIVPEKSRKKALKLARKIWNKKLKEYKKEKLIDINSFSVNSFSEEDMNQIKINGFN